jgi:hypothetical protein
MSLTDNQLIVSEAVRSMHKLKELLSFRLKTLHKRAAPICKEVKRFWMRGQCIEYKRSLLHYLQLASEALDDIGQGIIVEGVDGIVALSTEARTEPGSTLQNKLERLDCLELLLSAAIPLELLSQFDLPGLDASPKFKDSIEFKDQIESADSIASAQKWLRNILDKQYAARELTPTRTDSLWILQNFGNSLRFLSTMDAIRSGDVQSKKQAAFRLLTLRAVRHSIIPHCAEEVEGVEKNRSQRKEPLDG